MTTNSIDIIRLNVGGQHFITTRATLCAVEGSVLATMFCSDSNFAPPIEIEGKEVFLDRNPIAFGYILDYLRVMDVVSWWIYHQTIMMKKHCSKDFVQMQTILDWIWVSPLL